MGCRGSKHALHGGAWAPERRSYSGMVALRSSSLGTLSLDRAAAAAAVSIAGGEESMMKSSDDGGDGAGKYRATRSFVEDRCPLRDPEEINVWELMEGLDDEDADQRVPSAPGSPEFDPDVLAAFRDALEELSPPPDAGAREKKGDIQVFVGLVRARVDAFQQGIDAKPPDSARRVVVYLTSLRGIRQTYEDCWAASAILRGYGVHVDERDLSMHAGYKDELRAALAGAHRGLPQVFVDGRHLGGAEEVRRMHESGELADALAACEMAPGVKRGGSLAAEPCAGCGGVRFVPCDECSGSCKVFVDDDDGDDGIGAFKRCPECNENGLVRCPVCS